MKTRLFTFLLFLQFCISGCSDFLSPGDSFRKEAKKVLEHYSKNPGDSLKLKAAKFLIEHIPYHYSYSGESAKFYYTITDSVLTHIPSTEPYLQIDAFTERLSNINFHDLIGRKDSEILTADFLISHIDSSFQAFTYPWNKDLTFENFCEYILPYRYKHEPLENWRPLYHTHFSQLLDSCKSLELTSYDVCHFLSDYLTSTADVTSFNTLFVLKLDLPPTQLFKISTARCSDLTAKSVYTMRSWGLPVSGDFTPQWGNRSLGHDWNILLNQDSVTTYQIGETDFGEHIIRKQDIDKLTKVYRYMFSVQKESLAFLKPKEPVPPFFRNPFIKDVTAEYVPTTNIEVNIEYNHAGKKFAYLTVFDNKTWQPVDWGKIEKNKIRFSRIPLNCMYLVSIYENGEFIPVSYPFYINESEEIIRYQPTMDQTQDMILTRKYPLSASIWHVLHVRMIGGVFQVADRPDFKDAKIIHTITNPEGPIKRTIEIDLPRPYRYFRYLSPDGSFVNMAEMEVYSTDNKKLTGDIIGTEGSYRNRRGFDKTAVFDGDVLTFFDAPEPVNGWVGLDFRTPQQIGKFIYIPRNDDNEVNEGEMYELFYFDKKWISLGRKIGTASQYLEYQNVPINALLWLRNHSKGKEERIFTFENGEQKWW